jgi:hypothetical protein
MPFVLRRSIRLLHALIMTLLATPLLADSTITTRPAVVELFTSQGCNSCPPADALLGELATRPDVLALAFHVDYWDYLGWRDRFALPVSAQRQRSYTANLQRNSAFTPQAIVDGQHSVVGSNRRSLNQLLAGTRTAPVIKLTLTSDALYVYLPDQSSHETLDVTAIAYLAAASTPIGRGENSGKLLHEFNIVRSIGTLGVWHGRAQQFRLPLATVPVDADHLAILIQQPQQGAIVGATQLALRQQP